MTFPYPSLLRPTGSVVLLLDEQPHDIALVELQLRRWAGPPLADTFGGKPLVDFGGRPVFAELCVYELFRLAGWQARWVSTFGATNPAPRFLTNWRDEPLAAQQSEPVTDERVRTLLDRIAARNGGYAGCWDVVGWHGEHLLFAELKRRKKDRLQPTQPRWLAAALACGLRTDNFLVVEWDFAAEQL